MDATEWLGYIAGTISTLTFLPQVIKTWKTKSAKDISLFMFVLVTVSVILWLIHGLLIQKGSIIYTNSVILILSVIMLWFKIKFKSQHLYNFT